MALVCSRGSYAQDYGGTPLSWWMVVSHLLMIQNWIHSQVFTLDAPLWSVAVECQIYVLFPLVVILWRRSRWVALFVAFVVAHGVLYATHHGGNANFLFLFVEGMLGAELAFSKQNLRWLGPVTLLSIASYLVSLGGPYVIKDIFVGLSTALLMAYLTRHRSHWGNRLLGWKPLAWIGTFSYSIYLIHSFFQLAAKRWLIQLHLSHGALSLFLVGVVGPIAVAASYGFHVVFERPFMSQRRQLTEKSDRIEVVQCSTFF
jgi:peptidoglycan/LPS O-acetylase OafA/YrhL